MRSLKVKCYNTYILFLQYLILHYTYKILYLCSILLCVVLTQYHIMCYTQYHMICYTYSVPYDMLWGRGGVEFWKMSLCRISMCCISVWVFPFRDQTKWRVKSPLLVSDLHKNYTLFKKAVPSAREKEVKCVYIWIAKVFYIAFFSKPRSPNMCNKLLNSAYTWNTSPKFPKLKCHCF